MSLYPILPEDPQCNPNHFGLGQTHSLLPVCSVCLDDFTQKRPPKYLSCHHTFCEECIYQLAKCSSVECPLCRRVTTVSSIDALQTNNDVLTMAKYGNIFINLWCEDCGTSPRPSCTTHHVYNKAAPPQPTFYNQVGTAVEAWRPTVVRVVETAQGWAVVAADTTYTTVSTLGQYVSPSLPTYQSGLQVFLRHLLQRKLRPILGKTLGLP